MKRITSFLLTLVMLVGMLPGVAIPAAAAQDGALNAFYISGNLAVDGKLDEAGWLLNGTVGSTPIGMQCRFTDLYIGLQTRADKVNLTIDGINATAALSTGAVTIGGESVGSVAYNTPPPPWRCRFLWTPLV